MRDKKIYPFSAIVGQDMMKKALILNIINPSIGGVLIRGEKGTAKSTAVRSIIELMEDRKEVVGCLFNCDPDNRETMCQDCLDKEELEYKISNMKVVELPVSATEDRVVGTLDIEKAIKKGEKSFEAGILAKANRNILYVDEVNLLDDHVIDVLLDSAAMGINRVEREGVSFIHPSRFILVGTMNPEEGDIRPQLLDRFGMVADVVGEKDVEDRMEVVFRRLKYEENPDEFIKSYDEDQEKVRKSIIRAKNILHDVEIDIPTVNLISSIAIELGVDGHRADITMVKAAMTLAALDGRIKMNKEDVKEAAVLVLPHRMRRRPFEEGHLDLALVEELIDKF